MSVSKNSQIQLSIGHLLTELGEDLTRDGLLETPKRFEKQLRECLAGYQDDPLRHVKLFDSTDFHDLVIVSKLAFSSLCEHHVLPFYGYVDVAYVPGGKILGLSKFARIIDSYSKRLQVQERLTKELAEFLYKHLEPELIMVRVNATHSCMTVRGVRQLDSKTETISVLGNADANGRHIEHFQNMHRKLA